jgi:hypothetical protein
MLVIKSEHKKPISQYKKEVYSPRFDALDVHIWFSQCKWVDIVLLQICKRMVDEPVGRLVRSHRIDHV